jgi:hypothetical protein
MIGALAQPVVLLAAASFQIVSKTKQNKTKKKKRKEKGNILPRDIAQSTVSR